MIEIHIDKKIKAEIPTDNTNHKDFITILTMYLNNYEWKTFKLKRVEKNGN